MPKKKKGDQPLLGFMRVPFPADRADETFAVYEYHKGDQRVFEYRSMSSVYSLWVGIVNYKFRIPQVGEISADEVKVPIDVGDSTDPAAKAFGLLRKAAEDYHTTVKEQVLAHVAKRQTQARQQAFMEGTLPSGGLPGKGRIIS